MLLMLQKLHNKNKNSFMYTICYSFSNTLYWNLTEMKKETKKKKFQYCDSMNSFVQFITDKYAVVKLKKIHKYLHRLCEK